MHAHTLEQRMPIGRSQYEHPLYRDVRGLGDSGSAMVGYGFLIVVGVVWLRSLVLS
jgi:hypothetical protein